MNKPTLCKEHSCVIHPAQVQFGGADVDVDWLEKVDCNEDCPKYRSSNE